MVLTGFSLNGTGIDISGFLNGTGFSLNGTGIDISGLLNGTGISFNGTTLDISGLLNGTGLNISGLSNGTGFNMSGLFNGTGIDLSGLLNGTGINLNGTGIDISGLLNGTGISLNGTTFDISGLLNGTGISLNGTTFDISGLLNGTGLNISGLSNGTGFNISSIIDIFGGKKDSINSTDLTKYYTQTTTFKVTVKNGDAPLTSGNVVFTIDNKEYVGSIGSDGVASVKIKNLKPGKHYITSEYAQVMVKNTITVKKAVITKNVSKKYKKSGKFTVKILNSKGKVYAKQKVKVKFKGKTYNLITNSKGIATLKLAKNLKVGKYTVKTTYKGLTVSNKITVKK